MNRELFRPSAEGEARLLVLIDAFTSKSRGLQGRTKLAKLDFLLRYPAFFSRAMADRGVAEDEYETAATEANPIEQRMVRYRYGPWDPSYYALLGSLIGRRLVEIRPYKRGLGYATTEAGSELASELRNEPSWKEIAARVTLLRRHMDLSGSGLQKKVYELFPEVAESDWSEEL